MNFRGIVYNGSTFTLGGRNQLGSSPAIEPQVIWCSGSSRFACFYRGGSGYPGRVLSMDIDTATGNLGSYGNEYTVHSSSTYYPDAAYDPNTNTLVYVNANGNSYGVSRRLYISGNSIGMGSTTTFDTSSIEGTRIEYDTSAQAFVVMYKRSSQGIRSQVTTVTGNNGTTISWPGNIDVVHSGGSNYSGDMTSVYDSYRNKVVLIWKTNSASYISVGTTSTSGTAATTWGTAYSWYSSGFGGSIESSFNASANKVYFSITADVSPYRREAYIVDTIAQTTNLTADNFIGISNGAYTNGQTATIQVVGSVDDAQSGLTAGSKYFVQPDGTLATSAGTPSVEAGVALSSTKLLIK
jgi:hypothetical protein